MKNSRIIFIVSFFAFLLFSCAKKEEAYFDPRGVEYAGAESCIQCHKTIHENGSGSAHSLATAQATIKNVWGDFDSGKHVFVYDQKTKLVLETRNDSLYQVLYKDGKEVKAYKLDVVFGSKKAQTFAYWLNNSTYELPISYYQSAHNWGTSPGFPSDRPYFDRKVVKDCYACHSSNVSDLTPHQNKSYLDMYANEDVLDKKTIVYGIDCERCHGPAKKHVDHHLKFPNEKTAQQIVSYKTLTNQQKLDACAICHSGVDGLKVKSRFDFKPGDNLTDFYRRNPNINNDVHGDQAGLLAQSQCFIKSDNLNCTTCHSLHENNQKSLASYAKVCISCHQTQKHTPPTATKMKNLTNNCITCHMPKQSSGAINFHLSNDPKISSYNLSTHKIAVYLDQSD